MLRHRRGSLTSISKTDSTDVYKGTVDEKKEKIKKQSLHQKPKFHTEGLLADFKELMSESKRLCQHVVLEFNNSNPNSGKLSRIQGQGRTQ